MGKASITIAVNGKWNGKGAIDAAASSLGLLNKSVSGNAKQMADYLTKQENNAKRMSRLAASTAKSSSADLAQVGNSIVEQGGRIYQFGAQMASVGDTLTKSVTVPMVAIGAAAGTAAVGYDTALANVRKASDMTESQLSALGQSAIELSKTQPVTADQILNIEALGAQFGIADDKLESFSKTVSGLDIATNMDAETAATQMAQFANITGMADDQFQNYGSTLVAIGNNMATTEDKVSAMSLRFASAGHQAGLSDAQILGMSGALSSLGVEAELGGSALSRTFTDISLAVSEGGGKLEAFASRAGMSAEQFASAWKDDAAGAFTALLQGIKDASDSGEDMNVVLDELGINQIRQSDVMRRLAGSVDTVTGALDLSTDAWQSNTALQAEVDARNESMAARLQVLQNKVQAVGIEVGGPLVNALISALDSMQPLFDAIESGARSFADADEGTQQFIVGIAGIAAASGPVLSILGRVTEGVGGLTASFGHAVQDVAVYEDAMNTVDGSQMRVYSSAETTATKMGLVKNKVAEAAGGVSTYVSKWEEWSSASKQVESKTTTLNGLIAKQDGLTGKAAKSNAKLVESLQDQIREAEATRDASAGVMDGWKKTAGVMDDAGNTVSKSTGLLSKLGDGAKLVGSNVLGMVANFGAMAAVSVVVGVVAAAIGDYVARSEAAKKRTEDLESASRSLVDMQNAAAGSAQSQAEGLGDVSEKAADCLQSIIDLNNSTQETWDNLATQGATLDSYVATIEDLTSKTSLSAVEQERLKIAVQGYNDMTGQSVEITDLASGTIDVSTEALQRNADAWKRNAEMQALQNVATSYMEEEARASITLSEAQDTLGQRQARWNELHERSGNLTREEAAELRTLSSDSADTAGSIAEAQKAVDDANASLDAATTSADQATQQLADLNDAYAQFAQGDLGAVFRDSGVDVDDLAGRLRDLGADTEALNGLTADQLAQIVADYGTSTDGILQGLEDYGVGMDHAGEAARIAARDITGSLQSIDGASGALASVGINMDDFASKCAEAGLTTADFADMSGSDFQRLAEVCGGSVDDMIALIKQYNGVPVEDKDADVSVEDRLLVDAQGNVWLWNGTTLVDKNGKAAVNIISLKDAQGNVYTWNGTQLLNKDGTAAVNDTSVIDAQGNVYTWNGSSLKPLYGSATVTGNLNGMLASVQAWNSSSLKPIWGTLTVQQRYTSLHVPQATGGLIVNHAEGGVISRFMADGGIAPRAMDVKHIVGEAGAEAVIPLTNSRYVRPFAQTVAHEMLAASTPKALPATNNYYNYSIVIDGKQFAGNQRATKALGDLVAALDVTSRAGVSY